MLVELLTSATLRRQLRSRPSYLPLCEASRPSALPVHPLPLPHPLPLLLWPLCLPLHLFAHLCLTRALPLRQPPLDNQSRHRLRLLHLLRP